MIAVDLDESRFYHDGEIKDRIASAQPYGEWVKGFTSFSGLKGFDAAEPAQRFERAELMRRQVAAGRTLEDRSEEHTSELQSLMRISYDVVCLKKKNEIYINPHEQPAHRKQRHTD